MGSTYLLVDKFMFNHRVKYTREDIRNNYVAINIFKFTRICFFLSLVCFLNCGTSYLILNLIQKLAYGCSSSLYSIVIAFRHCNWFLNFIECAICIVIDNLSVRTPL